MTVTDPTTLSPPRQRTAARGGLAAAGRGAWWTLACWWRRAVGRAQLAGLDADLRADIGVRWEDARAEADKPFWRP